MDDIMNCIFLENIYYVNNKERQRRRMGKYNMMGEHWGKLLSDNIVQQFVHY